MRIVYNRWIPFKGFFAINLFGTYFIRNENKKYGVSSLTLNHEAIHTEQMKELGYIFFYIWYFIEWLIRLLVNGRHAYRMLSFEREAFENQNNPRYLKIRKRYNWLRYYGKKK